MKVKASVTIEEKTLTELDGYVSNDNNRSMLVQEAIDQWLERQRTKERRARDVRLLEEHHESLNREMAEVLEFQEWE